MAELQRSHNTHGVQLAPAQTQSTHNTSTHAHIDACARAGSAIHLLAPNAASLRRRRLVFTAAEDVRRAREIHAASYRRCSGAPLRACATQYAGLTPCHICTGTGLAPATSAPGLGSPLPHLHWDQKLTPATPGPRLALRCGVGAGVGGRSGLDASTGSLQKLRWALALQCVLYTRCVLRTVCGAVASRMLAVHAAR